jgi:hypothetical protein
MAAKSLACPWSQNTSLPQDVHMSWAGPEYTSGDGFIVKAVDRIIFNNCTLEQLFRSKYVYNCV